MRCLSFLLSLLVVGLCHCQQQHHHDTQDDILLCSVSYDVNSETYDLHPGIFVQDSVARATFQNRISTTGWSYLEVSTNDSFADGVQAYAAGLAEALLTSDLMGMHWRNLLESYCVNETQYCNRLKKFLQSNLDYINHNIEQRPTDPYWYQVSLILSQVSGIEDGWIGNLSRPRTKMDVFGAMLFNLMGDMEDLEGVLRRNSKTRVLGGGSCSALVKVLPGHSDLYFSHDTWNTFSSMIRILKKYTFPYRTSPKKGAGVVPGHTVAFSSYPGSVFSMDDFYLLSSGLAVMETTNSNSNESLWRFINSSTVLDWTRNLVANRLASTGQQWTQWFRQHNSGTYNNQFMVVDYKMFKPGQPLKEGLLWVLEQMPGYIESADVTEVLQNQTYWASYNTPYFPKVFNMSGAPAMVIKYGDWFSYNNTPRARIFRRDQRKVKDLTSMIKLMRYNDFQHDPLSRCNCSPPYSAENAISARCDLNDPRGRYPFASLGHRPHGATDMKLTNASLFSRLEFVAISGPTSDSLPPFRWSTSGLHDRHEGHPDIWQFGPIVHAWGKGMLQGQAVPTVPTLLAEL